MNTVTVPKFEGNLLIPEIVTEAGFLRGGFGKAVLREYQGRVKTEYQDAPVLNVLSWNDQQNVVQGSNPFAVVLVNQILRQSGQPCLRTATPADLERILATNALELLGPYEDSALVLRTADEPNRYLAKDLMAQVQARVDKKSKAPYMIPLAGLDLKGDQDSQYGLAFKLRDDAEIVEAPILSKCGSFSSADINEKTGLPTKLSTQGDRTLYTRETGLSRLCLGRSSDLYSYDGDLQFSGGNGRVVVVGGEATAKNFESEIRQEYDRQRERLEERYKKALATLNEKE